MTRLALFRAFRPAGALLALAVAAGPVGAQAPLRNTAPAMPNAASIPAGSMMEGSIPMDHAPGDSTVYTVVNGPWKGCAVTLADAAVMPAAVTSGPSVKRVNMTGATVHCLKSQGRPAD